MNGFSRDAGFDIFKFSRTRKIDFFNAYQSGRRQKHLLYILDSSLMSPRFVHSTDIAKTLCYHVIKLLLNIAEP